MSDSFEDALGSLPSNRNSPFLARFTPEQQKKMVKLREDWQAGLYHNRSVPMVAKIVREHFGVAFDTDTLRRWLNRD